MKNKLDAAVEEKVNFLNEAIQSALSGWKISYLGCGNLICKFQLVREGRPPCQIDFAWEYLLNHKGNVILDGLKREKVFELLSNTHKALHILVTQNSVREVNEDIKE